MRTSKYGVHRKDFLDQKSYERAYAAARYKVPEIRAERKAYASEYRSLHKASVAADKAAYRKRPSVVANLKAKVLWQTYGVTIADYQRMLAEQGGGCAICGVSDPGSGRKYFSVDHNHRCCAGAKSCGKCVRGLLCNGCNRAEGFIKTTECARALLQYMERYEIANQ